VHLSIAGCTCIALLFADAKRFFVNEYHLALMFFNKVVPYLFSPGGLSATRYAANNNERHIKEYGIVNHYSYLLLKPPQ